MVEEAIIALLSNDVDIKVADRVFHEHGVTTRTFPYIIFMVDGIEAVIAHDGGAGIARATIRVECYGATDLEGINVADAARKKVQGFIGTIGGVVVQAIIVQEAGRDESIMPDDGSQNPEWIRVLVLTVWYEDASN